MAETRQLEIAELSPTPEAVDASSEATGVQAYLFIAALFFLTNFAAPNLGLVDIPVSFFLKNRLHLSANGTAVFHLIVAIPLILGFVFGFVRDRWSPVGHGDRAHLLIFSLATTAIYIAMGFAQPSYATLALGVFVATSTYQMTSSVANGVSTVVGRDANQAGGMAAATLIAAYLPQVLGFFVGGVLSQALEAQNAVIAARVVYLCAGLMMVLLAIVGFLGPASVYAAAERARTRQHLVADLKRLVRHWPIYPVLFVQALWQFSPATATVLQYHLANSLHGTDAQWGEWNAVFIGAFIPGLAIYSWACRRVQLRWLIWGAFGLAVLQMTPLLLVRTANQAIAAAAALGVMGAFAQAALVDLCIRSAPKGLESTMMMAFLATYWISFRSGDLAGTWMYDRWGFVPPVLATTLTIALCLPVLLLVPSRLLLTRDGEPIRQQT
ncbi:hypothetical protein [Phenylobacterium montanum]|uniref:MFS transporter n=1 Tax=Phenylobacterium montanum TaxID=2823693 RepID=A0A975G218_9CAUL|nr:hypothetical protein [Caulobacter sp. S6]QUD89675.1 hypothetical protein KCG34_07330 [Caulobacter sp. S6]